VRAIGAQKPVVAKGLGYVFGHAVPGVGLPLRRIPEVMGDELEEQAFGHGPGQGADGRSLRPGLEIGDVRG